MNTTFANRINELYGDQAQISTASMAMSLRNLAKIGIAACDSNANLSTTFSLASLFEAMGAIAAELEDALEAQEEAMRKRDDSRTQSPSVRGSVAA